MSDGVAFLLSDVSRLLRRRFDTRARAIGVTRPQWRVLTTLHRNEGAKQNLLAEMLEVEPITVCRMIDRLAEAGLVERRPDPEDRRAWRLYLTDRAIPLIDKLRGVADTLVDDALRDLTRNDVEQLERMLKAIHRGLAPPIEAAEARVG